MNDPMKPEKAEAFLKMLRRQGVQAFEGFGIRVRLGALPSKPIAATEQTVPAGEDPDLFYSSEG
jgi:hypothetical protein